MRTSESIGKIAPALVKAQAAIRFAVKDSVNPHLKNRYADLASVITACKEHLNTEGIAVIQMPEPSEPGYLSLTTRLQHESGEWLEATASCPLPKSDPQGYGSALTYTRRYSLAAAVGLYQDDDDAEDATPKKKQSTVKPTAGVFESLTEPAQRRCMAAAEATERSMTQGGVEAATIQWLMEKKDLSTDEQVAAWSLLDSKTRSAVYKHGKGENG